MSTTRVGLPGSPANRPFQRFRRFCLNARENPRILAATAYRWLKWPAFIAAASGVSYYLITLTPVRDFFAAVGEALGAFFGLIGNGIEGVVTAIAFLIGALIQIITTVIAIPLMSLFAVFNHLFLQGQGSEDPLSVSFEGWVLANRDQDSSLYWGVWDFDATTVYIFAAIATYVLVRFLLSGYAKARKLSEELVQVKNQKSSAEYQHQGALERAKEEARDAAVRKERSTVWRAYIHTYRPKHALPPIPEGTTRWFWINVVISDGVRPIQDRTIHWADYSSGDAAYRLGAPMYRIVKTGESELDKLTMLGVVYTLNKEATTAQ